MDDVFSNFFGNNDMSDDEMKAKEQELLGQVEVDHVIQGGKVYLSADRLIEVFDRFAKIMALRAILTSDVKSLALGEGVAVTSEILTQLNGEMLKRQAEKSL